MNDYKLLVDKLKTLIQKQNPKARIKIIHDVLNSNEIQIDVLRNNTKITIDDVTELLYGSGFKRLFITVGKKVKLTMQSDECSYVIRTNDNCDVISSYSGDRDRIFVELGINTKLSYSGAHDIKSNRLCKIKHIAGK